jgi:hypothetical protein
MTETEAFKIGFISRCLHDGVPPTQIPGVIKTAFFGIGDILRAGTGVVTNIGVPAALTAAAAPVVLGGTGAYLKNTALDSDSKADLDLVKSEELRRTLLEQARRLRELHESRNARSNKPKQRQIFL